MKVFLWFMCISCAVATIIGQAVLWATTFNTSPDVPLYVKIPVNMFLGGLFVAFTCAFGSLARDE